MELFNVEANCKSPHFWGMICEKIKSVNHKFATCKMSCVCYNFEWSGPSARITDTILLCLLCNPRWSVCSSSLLFKD